MRDILIYVYFHIDVEIVWHVVQHRLTDLTIRERPRDC
jgi:uncharacterized protein with HEPN domain